MADKNIQMFEMITELSDLVGISSREQRIIEYVNRKIKDTSYSVIVDNIGNVIIQHKLYSDNKKKVLIFAHSDEIGIIVRKIDVNGYIYFERIGGVNTQILPGTKFQFDTKMGLVEGVVGVQSHHFMSSDNKFSIPLIQDMYIDICAKNREETLLRGIDVGTFAVFQSKCVIKEECIRGKALDNRVAVGMLLQIAIDLEFEHLSYSLAFCFPVQEEFNIRGLMPVLRRLKPEISIGIDITPACDTPDMSYNSIKLGEGPAITCMNFHGRGTLAGVLPDEEIFDSFCKTAKDLGINLQKEIAPGVITENAFGVFENDTGIKVVNLSIPTRYTHTPFETVSIDDVNNMYTLLKCKLAQGFSK